jgi:hypothetical protein
MKSILSIVQEHCFINGEVYNVGDKYKFQGHTFEFIEITDDVVIILHTDGFRERVPNVDKGWAKSIVKL